MTNDTKAPERIWAGNWLADCGETDWDIGEWRDEKWPTVEVVGYIRHDLHMSIVAAAYDDAASRVNQLSHKATYAGNFTQASSLANEAEDIREAAPTDAQAALEARDRRIREEIASVADQLGWHCIGCGHICGDPEKDLRILKKAGALACCPEREMEPLSKAILALIEKEQTDE